MYGAEADFALGGADSFKTNIHSADALRALVVALRTQELLTQVISSC